MTNTLHRLGTHESLSHDYIIFVLTTRGVNRTGAAEKIKRFLQLALEEDPVNVGAGGKNLYTSDPEAMLAGISDDSGASVAFSDPEALRRLVGKLKEANLGLSIDISGLADEVDEMLRSQGMLRHSIEHSLGILGRTDRLPTRQILELTTMCGHGLVSHNHARKMIDWVKMGKLKPRQAAIYLARPCTCGSFNVDRAEELIAKAVEMA